jgi:hypothetical protein
MSKKKKKRDKRTSFAIKTSPRVHKAIRSGLLPQGHFLQFCEYAAMAHVRREKGTDYVCVYAAIEVVGFRGLWAESASEDDGTVTLYFNTSDDLPEMSDERQGRLESVRAAAENSPERLMIFKDRRTPENN